MLYLVTLQRYRMPEIYTDPQMARPVFRIKLHKNEIKEKYPGAKIESRIIRKCIGRCKVLEVV